MVKNEDIWAKEGSGKNGSFAGPEPDCELLPSPKAQDTIPLRESGNYNP